MTGYIVCPLLIAALVPSAYLFFIRVFLLFQLSSYRLSELKTALCRQRKRSYILPALLILLLVALAAVCAIFPLPYAALYLTAFPIFSAVMYLRYRKTRKLGIKCTSRFKSLVAVFSALCVLFFWGLCGLVLWLNFAAALLLLFLPLSTAAFFLAAALIGAVYGKRNRAFIGKTRLTLQQRPGLIKIGITGSAGKTTAKTVLAAFLSEKYEVLSAQGNYNTPMGVALTVSNRLSGAHEVFIAEMGARYLGDIAELCRVVDPAFGLYTNVLSQHAETFGGLMNVRRGKYELAAHLEKNGLAVFNGDDEGCRAMMETYAGEKLVYGSDPSYSAFYSDASFDERGSSFTLTVFGERAEIVTPLLGKHIPSVICGCALLAAVLGVPLRRIKDAAAVLQPVAHRLQLMYNGQDVIIDDAYNANERGAEAALDTLAAFRGRIKIVVTPGLVELGKLSDEKNRHLGVACAAAADYLVVLGPNAQSLIGGAAAAGMTSNRLFEVRSLNEIGGILAQIHGPKAILFENDLPDSY